MEQILSDSNKHLVDVLTQYYLDNHKNPLYIRWDTWLSAKGYIRECVAMMLKTDTQLNLILRLARENAGKIINSKLSGVLE